MKKVKDNKKVSGIFLKFFLFLFLIILLLTLSTCKNIKPPSKETTLDLPVTNTPFSTETKLLSEWVADGIISINEYDKSQVFSPDFTLYWRSDQQFVYFALKSHTNGWVALGFQPNPEKRKKNVDFVLAAVTQEGTIIADSYSISGPHYPDINLGGSNDIIEFAGKEVEGYTTVEFKRLLVTADKYDQTLSKGKNKIMWAWSNEDDMDSKHNERGYGEIEINE